MDTWYNHKLDKKDNNDEVTEIYEVQIKEVTYVHVKAFINVDRDRFSILKKGSLQGYFCDPHKTVCSNM
jgi:hypothetical protein